MKGKNGNYLLYLIIGLVGNLIILQTVPAAQDKKAVEFDKKFSATTSDYFVLTDTDDLTAISGYTGTLKRINVGTYEDYKNWQSQPGESSGKAFSGIYSIEWEELSVD